MCMSLSTGTAPSVKWLRFRTRLGQAVLSTPSCPNRPVAHKVCCLMRAVPEVPTAGPKCLRVKLTTYSYLLPRYRMRGTLPPRLLYSFTSWSIDVQTKYWNLWCWYRCQNRKVQHHCNQWWTSSTSYAFIFKSYFQFNTMYFHIQSCYF